MSLWRICFSYTSISDQTITKQKQPTPLQKKKKKCCKNFFEIFCNPLTRFILSQLRRVLTRACSEGHEYPPAGTIIKYFKVNYNDIRQDIVYNVSL